MPQRTDARATRDERNQLRVRDDEHPWRGVRGRGAYADRPEANHVGKPVRIACPITRTDLARIRREIAAEPGASRTAPGKATTCNRSPRPTPIPSHQRVESNAMK